ncbi:MAG: protein translocase subunit SecDF [Bacteroidota bacterium]
MQNKGAITLLAILLALASLYQLSFTLVVRNIGKDAEVYANGDFNKELDYLDSMAGIPVYPLLNYTLRECQEREINLGLDLKGGMNVTLEVSVIDVLRSLANYSTDKTFNDAIELAKKKQESSQEDYIALFAQAVKEIKPNASLSSFFATYENKAYIDSKTSDEDVLAFLINETNGAIDNSFEVLRNRIDRFGVAQPNIQRLETAGRILIELPGVKDPERVRKLLQGTASLEFWETYENKDVFNYLMEANKAIKEFNLTTSTDSKNDIIDTLFTDNSKSLTIEDSLKTNDLSLLANELIDTSDESSDTSKTLLEQFGTDSSVASSDTAFSSEQWEKEYPLFAILFPSQDKEGKLYPGPAVGMAHYNDTAKVNKLLAMKQVKAIFPKDLKFYWTYKPYKTDREETDFYQLIAIKVSNRDGRAPLDGKAISNARREFGQTSASAEVSMKMNGDGANIWAKLTKQNIGKSIAIVLDGYVYSYPTVQGEIKGGNSSITGNFDINEADDLANVLKSGKLPAPARIIEEAIVGPTLGQEAIDSGFSSFLIAFLIVLAYMVFYYSHRAGLIADIALIANLFFLIGVLASLQAVLTLPGIAGIVLTLGMAVDANIIIFERIKEEITAGKGLKLAIADGYKNAYSAIIDANVTTILTGIILYIFGTGPIKGFATTLVIGILTSLFSAIFITRLVFLALSNKNRKITFATNFTKNAFKNVKIRFIEKRKMFYIISSIIIIAGVTSIFINGWKLGIDFKGGRTFVVRFDQNVVTSDVAKALQLTFESTPEVKKFGSDNQVKISTTYMIDSDDPDADQEVEKKLYEGLQQILGADVDLDKFLTDHRMSSQKVGPTIAHDFKIAAIWAVVFSLLAIFIYILLRFRNWQYGLGAVTALIHDVIIVLSAYSLLYAIMPFSMEIDQAFIAAILTVVGYSINDTVIIFDRMREYIGLYKKRNRAEVINSALNSTISRTIGTSLTTLLVLLAIFIFGGEVIRGFIFAILLGITIGTYSSVFVAAPIVFDTIKNDDKKAIIKDNKSS